MLITKVEIASLNIPLIRPFITALRHTNAIEDIVVLIHCDNGLIGYGSAAATPVITGDSLPSIIGAIQIIARQIINAELDNFENLLNLIHNSMVNNNSAKAALDIAIHDLIAKKMHQPLYKFLGGGNPKLKILSTISVKNPQEMANDAKLLINNGFETLKIKIGLNTDDDLIRLKSIRQAIGTEINLIADANQGWKSKNALNLIEQLIKHDLNIAMIEQPVKHWDYTSLKYIRDNSLIPIYADEAIFNLRDATQIIVNQQADGINIKLMKTAGIYQARAIYDLANAYQVPCMAGCMLESPIGVAAMASFVCSRKNFTFIDLDPISMIITNPVSGGVCIDGANLELSSQIGLGINKINNLQMVSTII
ncbi:MAG: hypothetical protein RLZZ293_1396 [Pseudomonadota bacterium]|jgi:L-alanine-DL-glutamate epimerase-like enolase superfamily enzyme